MAIKLVELKQLGKETNETITSDKDEWISFLDFSAELYRYSTKNKVCMHKDQMQLPLLQARLGTTA